MQDPPGDGIIRRVHEIDLSFESHLLTPLDNIVFAEYPFSSRRWCRKVG